jgi:hypothetical protein
MGLKEEDRQIMVTLELEKAGSTFAENEGPFDFLRHHDLTDQLLTGNGWLHIS